jgi:hypothetical protein
MVRKPAPRDADLDVISPADEAALDELLDADVAVDDACLDELAAACDEQLDRLVDKVEWAGSRQALEARGQAHRKSDGIHRLHGVWLRYARSHPELFDLPDYPPRLDTSRLWRDRVLVTLSCLLLGLFASTLGGCVAFVWLYLMLGLGEETTDSDRL